MSAVYAEAAKKLEAYNPFIDIPRRICPVENLNTAGDKWVKSMQTNHTLVVRNCSKASLFVASNQRCNTIFIVGCTDLTFTILDSVVIANRTVTAINCTNCTFVFEDVDVRHFECFGVKNSVAIYIDSPPVVENAQVHWREDCTGNIVELGRLRPKGSGDSILVYDIIKTSPAISTSHGQSESYFDEVQQIFHKSLDDPVLISSATLLRDIAELEAIPFTLTHEELSKAYDKERDEYEEPEESLRIHVKEVAAILQNSKHTVCYTGAGVSTSANIPDFRGPQGVWTLKAKGVTSSKYASEDEIRPTFCHYGITHLASKNLINFVTTTNMDALHVRSGLPKHLICEQHGNGNKEVCEKCNKTFYRQYRTTYSTDFFTHHTGRFCDFCGGHLRDTIVNFSEVLNDQDMLISLYHARKSTAALVLGTSMNVQPAASFPDKCFKNHGKLIIVNLQKTPYDSVADVRVYARTDVFMKLLLEELNLTDLNLTKDVITEWDAPTDEVPLPPGSRRKYEAEKKRKMLVKWGAITAGIAAVVLGVYFTKFSI